VLVEYIFERGDEMDMRIFNPDRNKTSDLWKRLENGGLVPILLLSSCIAVCNAFHNENGSQIERIGLLGLLILLAIVSMITHRRTVKELKRRYERDPNKALENTEHDL